MEQGDEFMLHILIIGAGTMGILHAQAYARMNNAELVGIVDVAEDKMKELALKFNTKTFTSLEEALSSLKRIDVVDICLPTPLHKQYVLQVADAGKQIICEKPLARNLQDASDMISYCKEKNVKLFVGHVLRFFPEYIMAKRLVEEESVGQIAVARTMRGGSFPNGSNNWYADYQMSGGLVLDMLIHDFDFLRWCFGDVERVYAKGSQGKSVEPLDYTLVTLRFKSGVIAHVEGKWGYDTFSMKFELSGKTGVIDYDSAKDKPIMFVRRSVNEGNGGVSVPESPLKEDPYYLELTHFLACIEQDTKPIVTVHDAYEAMRIAMAVIESIETNEPIIMENFLELEQKGDSI